MSAARTDLRERLAAAIGEAGDCSHPGGETCTPWWEADAAITALGEWLTSDAVVAQMSFSLARSRAVIALHRDEPTNLTEVARDLLTALAVPLTPEATS